MRNAKTNTLWLGQKGHPKELAFHCKKKGAKEQATTTGQGLQTPPNHPKNILHLKKHHPAAHSHNLAGSKKKGNHYKKK